MRISISIIIGTLDLDGASTWLLTLAKYIDYETFDLELICLNHVGKDPRVTKRLEDLKCSIKELHMPRHKLNPKHYFTLHKHLKNRGTQVVVNANLQSAAFVRFICKRLSIRNIMIYQATVDTMKGPVRFQDSISRSMSDRIVGVSAEVIRTVQPFPAERSHVIFNSTEIAGKTDGKEYIEKFPVQDGGLRFCNIARYHPQKNQQNMIRGFAKFLRTSPGHQLVIAGWGELEDKLKAIVKEEGVADNIHVIGSISDPGNLMEASDYFLLPSNYEGLPLVLVEAIYLGCPLVVSPIAELKAIAQDNAHYLDGLTPDEIAKGLLEVVEFSESKKIQMGNRSKEIYSELFNPKNTTKQYEDLFKLVLS